MPAFAADGRLASALAGTASSSGVPSPVQQLTGLAQGIGALFMGDFAAFISGIFGAITVIAIFIIVWQLFTFIFEKTIFSIGGEFDSSKKYATWLGIGMGLIAIAVPHVYKFIYGFFGGFGMVVFVILVIVFALWKFVLSNRVDTAKENARFNEAQSENLRAKRNRKQEESDNTLRRRADRRVRKDISKGKNILKKDFNAYMSGQQIINKMKALMAQLASPNVNREVQAQVQHELMAKASAFAGMIKQEHKDMKKLSKLSKEIDRVELKELKLDVNEEKTSEKLIARIHKGRKNRFNEAEEKQIRSIVKEAFILDKDIEKLNKELEQVDVQELQFDDRLEAEIKKFQQAMNAGEFAQANNYLVDVDRVYNQVGKDDQLIITLLRRIDALENKKIELNKKIVSLEANLERREHVENMNSRR